MCRRGDKHHFDAMRLAYPDQFPSQLLVAAKRRLAHRLDVSQGGHLSARAIKSSLATQPAPRVKRIALAPHTEHPFPAKGSPLTVVSRPEDPLLRIDAERVN